MHARTRLQPEQLRSHRYLGSDDLRSFGHRSRQKQAGFSTDDFKDKPVIGILNTWNDLISCHAHFKQRVEDIKRGVWQAGGFPVEIPVMGLSETFMKPTSMYYRNLLAMEGEEVLRTYPIDAAVLMVGCDKTTPALLMGALSADVPSIVMPAGPMNRTAWHGAQLASGTDVWRFWAERGAGRLSCEAWCQLEDHIAASPGHCMTMGTASTMTALAEVMGMTLAGASSIPATHSGHARMASMTGRQAVELAWLNVKPSEIVNRTAFENAITTLMAIGGSTNAIVHLMAMAGRTGVKLTLEDFDLASQRTPVLANLRPAGKFVMADFFDAGGLNALLVQIADLLHLDAQTVEGQTLRAAMDGAEIWNDDVIRRRDNPICATGSLAVLRGNLAPDGCVIKPAAAEAELLQHRGPAAVFKDYPDLKSRIDDASLALTKEHVIVLQNAGPLGAPGIPEWGMLPIPKYLLEQGVRDMVRISDARMSGTSYGACVLHVSPESFVGGPLALVHDGDMITLDVAGRRLHLEISDEEMATRKAGWKAPTAKFTRGYGKLYLNETTQAHEGCDFRFLHADGSQDADPSIY
ncbi:MAG: dihydroxy-acid dehydratase [Planctomycetota bacterium]|nr:L-arabinonate dehydratase [Planctomycetales bacterium]RLT11185.1 MAG: dihydroxy-acid dehydratase [Planctomycetota bacterium]